MPCFDAKPSVFKQCTAAIARLTIIVNHQLYRSADDANYILSDKNIFSFVFCFVIDSVIVKVITRARTHPIESIHFLRHMLNNMDSNHLS